jgi:hypothetical protein
LYKTKEINKNFNHQLRKFLFPSANRLHHLNLCHFFIMAFPYLFNLTHSPFFSKQLPCHFCCLILFLCLAFETFQDVFRILLFISFHPLLFSNDNPFFLILRINLILFLFFSKNLQVLVFFFILKLIGVYLFVLAILLFFLQFQMLANDCKKNAASIKIKTLKRLSCSFSKITA